MTVHLPIANERVTLPFASDKPPYSRDNLHRGVDMSPYPGARGEPVYAWCDGKVKATGDHPTAGRYIIFNSTLEGEVCATTLDSPQPMKLENGTVLETHYYHLQDIYVSPGTQFEAGDTVGTIGSTGKSTGPHLHFEIRLPGNIRIDPLRLFYALKARGEASEVSEDGRAKFRLEVYSAPGVLLFSTEQLGVVSINGEPVGGEGGKVQFRIGGDT